MFFKNKEVVDIKYLLKKKEGFGLGCFFYQKACYQVG